MIYNSLLTPLDNALLDTSSIDDTTSVPLICFSHLRWGFVWQRPQHLLTRFAQNQPVYVVEEPLIRDTRDAPSLHVTKDADVTILTPSLSGYHHPRGNFRAANNVEIRDLLSEYFRDELADSNVITWYYTPMALGALPVELHSSLIVYDAMDELANFHGAPKELRDQERELMRIADLVFAGGPSLHEARKFHHPRTFCFPSGVEVAHFQSGVQSRPNDLVDITSPIIGFYGVLDERVDFELVGGIADARPDWSIVMIGPVVKIQHSQLVHRPNIHYLGMKNYADLPRYLAHFDAAILPFALNDATRFISPTKTLEYLAGGKPVVSTAIKDVIELYGDVTEIANTPREFVSAIEHLWNESDVEKASRARMTTSILARYDWDVIAKRMHLLVDDALKKNLTYEETSREARIGATPDHSPDPALVREVAD